MPDERPDERVRREWPLDGADVEADVRAWREGAERYEDAEDDELLPAAELMARAVRHHVHGEAVLREDDLAVTVQSLLFAAGTPTGPGFTPQACRLARLALAVVARHGWQPPELGGDGHLPPGMLADADIERLLATAIGPDAADLEAFLRAAAPARRSAS